MTKNRDEKSAADFSRPISIERIKATGLRETISASESEREKLAERMKLDGLESLQFQCELRPWKKGGVRLTGRLTAQIEETCVVSLEKFSSDVNVEVERLFSNDLDAANAPDLLSDMEDPEDKTPDAIENGVIDIGEVAAEELALTLSPHPRKPGVVFTDHIESSPEEDGGDGRKNPFEVLKSLKPH